MTPSTDSNHSRQTNFFSSVNSSHTYTIYTQPQCRSHPSPGHPSTTMRFSISIFFTSLIPPLTHAMPTCQNDTFTPPLPSWTVNAFQAYTSPNLSYASFVINSTPTFPESNNRLCGISSNSSIYESIYQSKMILCEGRPQMWFQIQETEVVLRSTWKTES